MGDDKKQKVLIGVLAVLILGAGGYWFVLRDSGSGEADLTSGKRGEKVKRVRKTERAGKKKRVRREKTTTTERAGKTVRERSERTTKKKTRRTRSGGKVKKKKKTLPPAACLPPQDEWLEEIDPHSFHPRFV